MREDDKLLSKYRRMCAKGVLMGDKPLVMIP